jgi:hypothetical protein
MKWAASLLMFVGAGLSAWTGENMEDPKETLASLLPEAVAGWTASPAEDQVFNPETIFDYIDGAGEVYRSYNFRTLLSRRFRRDGAGDLVADLFDMGSSRDAFGVFTHDLDGEDAGLGQGSNYKGGLLSLWRDKVFVSLYAEEETAEAKAALLAVGAAVVGAVGRDGPPPELLDLLPGEFRHPRSVRYFHTHHVLNYHFFVSTENILGLGPTTEAVLSVRTPPGQPPAISPSATDRGVLLIIRYPDIPAASSAYADFLEAYMPDAPPSSGPGENIGVVQTEDGLWTAGFSRKECVGLIFREATAAAARRAMLSVRQALMMADAQRPLPSTASDKEENDHGISRERSET